MSVSEMEELF